VLEQPHLNPQAANGHIILAFVRKENPEEAGLSNRCVYFFEHDAAVIHDFPLEARILAAAHQ